jgi:predicted nucleic acid-binding protein
MKEIIQKLMNIEQETSNEKGEYRLFALFLREDSPNKWEILVAADWIYGNKAEALRYLAQRIQKSFTQNELLQISRIVIIEEDNPTLPVLQQAFSLEHGSVEIKDANFFGLAIKHAFIITSATRQVA